MRHIDYNTVINTLLTAQQHTVELADYHILTIVQDFAEGVTLDYLVTRLYLLGVEVNVYKVKVMAWKLIDVGKLDLTVERKFKFSTQKE